MRTEARKKEFGEVFTPPELVKEMLDKIPQDELLNPDKTVGDITGCGNGNFLIEVLNRRIAAGIPHKKALATIYGVDIMQDNIDECKQRLSLGSKSKAIWAILDNNIICADVLDKCHSGWKDVGYMWTPNPGKQFFNDLELTTYLTYLYENNI